MELENMQKHYNICTTPGTEKRKTKTTDAPWYKRKRYYVTLLTSLGASLAILLRLNLSIAIVEMTANRNITIGNETHNQEPEFVWSSSEKGFILSSFSWGYFFSIIGGILACKYGGTNIFSLGMLATALLTILTPYLIQFNTTVYVISRICEGITESFSMAAMTDIFVRWAPYSERSRLTTLAFVGAYIAPAFSYPICGYITKFYGWRALFHITGASVIPWFLVWWILIPRSPNRDRFISKAEKKYLTEIIDISSDKKIDYPWKKILTSKSVWALGSGRFIEAWYFSFVVYCLPLYVRDMQNIEIENVALISAIPHVATGTGLVLVSFIADYIRNNEICTVSTMHKIFVLYSHFMAIVTIIIPIVWTNFTVSIACFSLQRFAFAFANSSYCVLPSDIGGRYSGFLQGFAVTCISVGQILNPIIMGWMIKNHTLAEWNMYFLVLCILNTWSMTTFWLFGSGKTESWAV